MSYKKKMLMLLAISVGLFLSGYAIVYPEVVGLCAPSDDACIYGMPIFTIGEPLLFGSIPLIIVAFSLLFFSEKVFSAWKKFAMVYIIIAVILIAITPTSAGFLNPDKEDMSKWLAILFFIISIIIILVKREKGGSSNE